MNKELKYFFCIHYHIIYFCLKQMKKKIYNSFAMSGILNILKSEKKKKKKFDEIVKFKICTGFLITRQIQIPVFLDLSRFLFKLKMKQSKQEHGKLLVNWGKRRNKYKQKGGKFYTANEMENRDYTTMTIPDAEL